MNNKKDSARSLRCGDWFGLRRRLSMMNLAAISCLCCGLFWGLAFDDFAQGRDSAFFFFSGLLLANMACGFNWLAWRGCPNKISHAGAHTET